MKKPELLAPAGSLEKAITAFKYGADAVYLGIPKLSLRNKAGMEEFDIEKIVEYAHKIDKKVFVAINIFARDELYNEIKKQIRFLYKIGVDAIIAADPGIVEMIKEYAPDIPIHISTQANTISYHTANFWHKNGASRIILGRELSKYDIEEILGNKAKDLEIEIFVHGALCVAYSGRCFLSQFMADKSANTGECLQPCRWNYNLYAEEIKRPGEYFPVVESENGITMFSSKDLCLINEIPEIIDMGVNSLKIEGRLKSDYYVATIVHIYRKAIDDYVMNSKDFDSSKYYREIEKLRTRALTTFYFHDKSKQDTQDISGRQYNEEYEYAAKTLEKSNAEKYVLVEIKNKLNIGDHLEIIVPEKLEAEAFILEDMLDVDSKESILEINPGKKEQQVILKTPFEVDEGLVIRKKI